MFSVICVPKRRKKGKNLISRGILETLLTDFSLPLWENLEYKLWRPKFFPLIHIQKIA